MNKILEYKNEITVMAHGDSHSGSVSALLPDDAQRIIDGTNSDEVPQNRIQRLLWKLFNEDLKKIGKVDIVVNNGDNIEGQQIKCAGRTLMDADVDSQKEWAISIEQKVIDTLKPSHYIGVAGTDYHVGSAGNADLEIYKRLSEVNKDVEFLFGEVIEVKIGKMPWGLAHPYPTTEMIAPPLEKLIKQHAIETYLDNSEKIRVFCRGHAHQTVWMPYRGNNYAFVTPCQQPTSRFSRSKAYLTVRKPDVGMLKITQIGEQLTPTVYLHPEIHRIIN